MEVVKVVKFSKRLSVYNTCISAGLFLSSPVFSAITIDVSLATDSNTPESAVANILRNPPSGVCDTLTGTNGLPLSSDQTHMLTFCNALNQTPDESTTGPAYTALSARSFSAINSYTANSFTSFEIGDIAKRLASLRRSASRSTTKSASLVDYQSPSSLLSSLNNPQPSGGGASADSSADEAGGLNDNRLSSFITGSFDDATQDETSTLAGYGSNVSYLFAGLDYRFNNNTFAGVALKTLSGDISLDANTGSIDISDNSLSVYASYYTEQNIYLQTALTYGQSSYDISRKIDFTLNNVNFNETANSNPDGKGLSLSVSSGYEHYFTGTGISTVTDISLAYAESDIDAFTEKAAQGFNLNVDKQSIESLTSKIGIQISQSVSTSFGVLLPEFSAAWKHEFKTDGEEVNAAFAIDPTKTFSFTTDDKESDYFLVSLATSVVLPHGIMAFIQYEQLLGIENYNKSTLNIGARIEF